LVIISRPLGVVNDFHGLFRYPPPPGYFLYIDPPSAYPYPLPLGYWKSFRPAPYKLIKGQ